MTSQTGYPMAVDFAGGAPRYRPHDGAASAWLSRGEVDAVLVVGDAATIGPDLLAPWVPCRCAVVGPGASDGPLATCRVVIDSARAGVHEAGTALRLDDVPLPLSGVPGRAAAGTAEPAGTAGDTHHMTDALRIDGGTVYDPANGIDGVVADVCVEGGRIVPAVPESARRIDARGLVVMPGGVDIHSHVAGATVNAARRLLPEEHAADAEAAPSLAPGEPLARSGSGGTVPTTFTTGYRYAGLGYTTVFDAAVAPLYARTSHAELDDTPIVDAGFYVLVGNDAYLWQLMRTARPRAGAAVRGVAAGRDRRLRAEGRQSRRCGDVEARRIAAASAWTNRWAPTA